MVFVRGQSHGVSIDDAIHIGVTPVYEVDGLKTGRLQGDDYITHMMSTSVGNVQRVVILWYLEDTSEAGKDINTIGEEERASQIKGINSIDDGDAGRGNGLYFLQHVSVNEENVRRTIEDNVGDKNSNIMDKRTL